MFGNWGYPGFNFPRPPMNFPGNMPFRIMGHPRVFRGFRMRPPNFPIYPSYSPFHNDVEFPENPYLDASEATGTTEVQPHIKPEENKNQTRVPVDLPKEVEKANPESQQVVSQPTSSGADAANPESQQVVSQPQSSGDGEPSKKSKTEEIAPPKQKPEIVINNKWRSDPSKMYSCDLCQYHTPDENLMEKHLNCYRHNVILQHLCDFFPRQKVELLQDYLIRKKNKMLMENKKHDIVTFNDKLEGIGERQFVHRIQAAHCQACDVLIPHVEALMQEHVESDAHHQNCQATLSKIKHYSPAIAAEILDELNMGQKPFKDVRSPQVSSTSEVLVAEEDEDNDHTNDKDAIEDAKDNPEVPVTHNGSPAHETKDSDNKMFLPDEPEINVPPTSSTIATSCSTKRNSPAVAPDYFGDEYISQILKKYRMGQDPFKDVAVQPPHVSSTNEVLVAEEDDDTNDEDTIDDARDDPEVPVTHNESPAHETKDSDKMFLPDESEMNEPANLSATVNPLRTVEEEEMEEEEEAAEAP